MRTGRHPERNHGITAVEVLSATVLSSLLMISLLTVMRGLKDQNRALDLRMPTQPWQRAINDVLEADLSSSQTYTVTEQSLFLEGFSAGSGDNGTAAWLPTRVVYEVVETKNNSWLVRRELPTASGIGSGSPGNLVMAGVRGIRVGEAQHSASQPTALPIPEELVIEFLADGNKEPVHVLHYRSL